MRWRVVALVLLAVGCTRRSPEKPEKPQEPPEASSPALTVFIVVDQFRGDELSAHRALLRGGLARMMDEGRWYSAAMHGHARTETASGHATLATGLLPRYHGIVSKTLYDGVQGELRSVCDYTRVDCEPDLLLAPTLGDRLRRVHPDAKIIAISQKPRSAVLLGGRESDWVAWIDHEKMRLVGRTRSGTALPPWLVRSFSRLAGPERVARLWEAPHLPDTYASWKDDVPDEVDAGSGTVFPHRVPDPNDHPGRYYWGWFASPDSDRVLLESVVGIVERGELGADSVPDLLLVGAGGFDAIGHSFGPDSVERLSALVELDRELGDLLTTLESRLGGRVLVALSSDHGIGYVPSQARARGLAGVRVKEERLVSAVERALAAQWGPGKYVRGLAFPFLVLESLGERQSRAAHLAASALEALPEVRRATVSADLRPDAPDELDRLLWGSAHPDRCGDVAIVLEPHHALWTKYRQDGGAEHGTPWPYDRHVPILLWGAGVEPGQVDTPVDAIDLTRTLADRLGIPPDPRGGKPLP